MRALEPPACNKVSPDKVITYWPDMLRVAGSLVTGQIRAYDLLRVVDPVDDSYRRRMDRQLSVREARHELARDIGRGKRGQIMQAYKTGQEDRFGALGIAAVL